MSLARDEDEGTNHRRHANRDSAERDASLQFWSGIALGPLPIQEGLSVVAAAKLDDLIRSPDPNDRKRAVVLLVRSGKVESIPWLLKIASDDPEAAVRYFAKKGLEQFAKPPEASVVEESGLGQGLTVPDTGDTIRRQLRSSDPAAQMAALKAVAAKRDPSLVPDLIELLNRPADPRVHASVVAVLGMMNVPQAEKAVVAALKADDHRVRANAVESLANLHRPEHLPLLVPFLQDPDNRTRANVARSLTAAGEPLALAELKKMLKSPEVAWRDSATFALGFYVSDAAVELLELAASDDEPTVAAKALAGLARLARKGSAGAAFVLANLETQGPKAGQAATDAMGLTDMDLGAAAVRDGLASPDPQVRMKAAFGAAHDLNSAALAPLLGQLKTERDPKVVATIVSALGTLGSSSEVVPVLLPFLKNADDRIRANAVETLGRHTEVSIVATALMPLLADTNNRVRANAVLALRKKLGSTAYEILATMAGDPDPLMRRSALYALDELGRVEGLSALILLATDSEPSIKKRALERLQQFAASGVSEAQIAMDKLGSSPSGGPPEPDVKKAVREAAEVSGKAREGREKAAYSSTRKHVSSGIAFYARELIGYPKIAVPLLLILGFVIFVYWEAILFYTFCVSLLAFTCYISTGVVAFLRLKRDPATAGMPRRSEFTWSDMLIGGFVTCAIGLASIGTASSLDKPASAGQPSAVASLQADPDGSTDNEFVKNARLAKERIAIAPKDMEAHFSLVQSLHILRSRWKAYGTELRNELTHCVHQFPGDPRFHLFFAMYFQESHDCGEALPELRKALEIGGDAFIGKYAGLVILTFINCKSFGGVLPVLEQVQTLGLTAKELVIIGDMAMFALPEIEKSGDKSLILPTATGILRLDPNNKMALLYLSNYRNGATQSFSADGESRQDSTAVSSKQEHDSQVRNLMALMKAHRSLPPMREDAHGTIPEFACRRIHSLLLTLNMLAKTDPRDRIAKVMAEDAKAASVHCEKLTREKSPDEAFVDIYELLVKTTAENLLEYRSIGR